MKIILFGIFFGVLLSVLLFSPMAFSETQENSLTLSSQEITKTKYSTEVKELVVKGHVSNYERGNVIHLINIFPSGEMIRFNTTGTDDGNFSTLINISKEFETGEYQLILEYDAEQIISTTYTIK